MSAGLDREYAGERIDQYRIIGRLAVGGMAEIFLAAFDGPERFRKFAVLKLVLPHLAQDSDFLEMFLDEARLSARFSHPNIAFTYDLGQHEGRWYLAMEYLPGESLARVLKRARETRQPLGVPAVIRIITQLLEGLDYCHNLVNEKGEPMRIVHRDVTPSNVVLTYRGGVKLLDFGIARAASRVHQTRVGLVKGKGGYVAPEQASGDPPDRRADVWAVGTLLYLLMTGRAPFAGLTDPMAMLRMAVLGNFPKPSKLRPDIEPGLEKIILKAMACVDQRYPTAEAMLLDLEAWASAHQVYPAMSSLVGPLQRLFPDGEALSRSLDTEYVDELAASFVDADEGAETDAQPAFDPHAKATVVLPGMIGDDDLPESMRGGSPVTAQELALVPESRPRAPAETRRIEPISSELAAPPAAPSGLMRFGVGAALVAALLVALAVFFVLWPGSRP